MSERFTLPEFEMEGADSRASYKSRRDLLEKSKLSRLPSLPKRTAFSFDNSPNTKMAVNAVCAGCGKRIDTEDNIQKAFCGCRACVGIYGRLDAAYFENANRRKRETLQKFVMGCRDDIFRTADKFNSRH